MRDKHYQQFTFRLSEETIEKLRELKKKEDVSWNLIINSLIKKYEEDRA